MKIKDLENIIDTAKLRAALDAGTEALQNVRSERACCIKSRGYIESRNALETISEQVIPTVMDDEADALRSAVLVALDALTSIRMAASTKTHSAQYIHADTGLRRMVAVLQIDF